MLLGSWRLACQRQPAGDHGLNPLHSFEADQNLIMMMMTTSINTAFNSLHVHAAYAILGLLPSSMSLFTVICTVLRYCRRRQIISSILCVAPPHCCCTNYPFLHVPSVWFVTI